MKLLVLMREFHQEKILKRTYFQVEKILIWIHQIKNLEEGISSSDVKILVWVHQVAIVVLFELELVKEYNIQVWFCTWGVDVGLSNHVKYDFAIFIS